MVAGEGVVVFDAELPDVFPDELQSELFDVDEEVAGASYVVF